MTLAATKHLGVTELGTGELWIDLLDAEGRPTGERYLGDSPAFGIATVAEQVEVRAGDGPDPVVIMAALRGVERHVWCELRDMSPENLALHLAGGEVERVPSVTPEAVTESIGAMRSGLWYMLGVTRERAGGAGAVDVEAVTGVDGDGQRATLVAGVDYDVEADRGFVVARRDVRDVQVRYRPRPGGDRRQVVALRDARPVECALRYIEEVAPSADDAPPARQIYIRRCQIGPDGTLELKSRTREQRIRLHAALPAPARDDPNGGIVISAPEAPRIVDDPPWLDVGSPGDPGFEPGVMPRVTGDIIGVIDAVVWVTPTRALLDATSPSVFDPVVGAEFDVSPNFPGSHLKAHGSRVSIERERLIFGAEVDLAALSGGTLLESITYRVWARWRRELGPAGWEPIANWSITPPLRLPRWGSLSPRFEGSISDDGEFAAALWVTPTQALRDVVAGPIDPLVGAEFQVSRNVDAPVRDVAWSSPSYRAVAAEDVAGEEERQWLDLEADFDDAVARIVLARWVRRSGVRGDAYALGLVQRTIIISGSRDPVANFGSFARVWFDTSHVPDEALASDTDWRVEVALSRTEITTQADFTARRVALVRGTGPTVPARLKVMSGGAYSTIGSRSGSFRLSLNGNLGIDSGVHAYARVRQLGDTPDDESDDTIYGFIFVGKFT